jgi:hypothetical protein
MTTLEIQASVTGPVRMPALTTEPHVSGVQGSPAVVVDCAADAWDESDKTAMDDLCNTFGDDLVDTHETALRRAGHWLIETHLRAEWRKRGFVVTFNADADDAVFATPADEVYLAVWQAAANAIADRDLVLEAGLGHVFQLTTELEMHRAALHYRLDELASDDMCDRAEQQLDGLRAAVDAAVTRPQLIEVSAQVDQLVTPISA